MRRAPLFIGVGLVVAAVATELRKPVGQRSWQGYVAGVVPYNFRLPQPAQMQRSMWESDRLLIPRSFGVGWSVNLPAVARRLRNRKILERARNRR
ncbi:MAG: hypothetical protein ACRDRM_13175 [Pseudonocardiaceae bacterium]